MSTATVLNIYRYPVKSMMGETLRETDIAEAGIPGDRGWAVRDENVAAFGAGRKSRN